MNYRHNIKLLKFTYYFKYYKMKTVNDEYGEFNKLKKDDLLSLIIFKVIIIDFALN